MKNYFIKISELTSVIGTARISAIEVMNQLKVAWR